MLFVIKTQQLFFLVCLYNTLNNQSVLCGKQEQKWHKSTFQRWLFLLYSVFILSHQKSHNFMLLLMKWLVRVYKLTSAPSWKWWETVIWIKLNNESQLWYHVSLFTGISYFHWYFKSITQFLEKNINVLYY